MAEVKKRKWTRGEEVMHARLDAETTEPIEWPYPSPAKMVAADTDFAMASLAGAARQGRTVVLFFPDGDEVVLTPSRPANMADKPWAPEPEILD
jgi:hypothetical protein